MTEPAKPARVLRFLPKKQKGHVFVPPPEPETPRGGLTIRVEQSWKDKPPPK